ncbi:hypothetical protein G6L78_01300 [Agrobacterium rhizogenes]|nr:hypothetical protein [Rhizobium rhizogenes]
MIVIAPFFRKIAKTVYPRSEVIVAHAVAVEPIHTPNIAASIGAQDIMDIEARFDVEGPICWRDPFAGNRISREHRRRAIAERHVGRHRE